MTGGDVGLKMRKLLLFVYPAIGFPYGALVAQETEFVLRRYAVGIPLVK
jgi:hypothetical protein